jgi:uncharacterized protein (TIGR02145 family)
MSASDDRVFLCHASEDKPRVIELYGDLKRAGLHPWVDKEDIPPASDWDREIAKNIRATRVFVVCVSKQLVSKTGYVQRELDVAFQMAQHQPPDTIFMINARLEDCEVPARYRQFTHVDLFQQEGVHTLIRLVKGALGLFTDPRDGQIYKTVTIGAQRWLAENLNYDVHGSRWYGDQAGNARPFGRLYTWDAALAACPPGWHLPDLPEWQQLALSVGASWGQANSALFDALIEGGKSAFNAVLGGVYDSRGLANACYEKLQNGYYWGGSPATGSSYMFAFSAKSGKRTFYFKHENRGDGLSCRYVTDI